MTIVSDNEELSAVEWERFVTDARQHGLQMTEGECAHVADYIRRTAHHLDGPASGDLALFLDADLSILAANWPQYAR